jgi:hypothetical protein
MMGKVTGAAPHLSISEVKGKLRPAVDFWLHQKWAGIYTALVDPRPAAAIAFHLGVAVPFVHTIISLSKRFGPAALETSGRGGRRHQSLTNEEEQQCGAPFLQRAAAGEMATIVPSKVLLTHTFTTRCIKPRSSGCCLAMAGGRLHLAPDDILRRHPTDKTRLTKLACRLRSRRAHPRAR